MKSASVCTLSFFEGRVASSIAASLRSLVPPLEFSHYKGVMGRIAVIGGSKDYTGAPYYAAEAALKFGADLSYVYCSSDAAIPIKSYSPELMVTPLIDDKVFAMPSFSIEVLNEIENIVYRLSEPITRLHTLVIGPGLGREHNTFTAVTKIINLAKEKQKLLVFDADGLFLLNQQPELMRGYGRSILTPNKVEFERLTESVIGGLLLINITDETHLQHRTELIAELRSTDLFLQTRALSLAMGGVTIMRKGAADIISNGDMIFEVKMKGSPRRCGGQGDILAGCIGTAFHWGSTRLLEVSHALADLKNLRDEHVSTVNIESKLDLNDVSQWLPNTEAMNRTLLGKTMIGVGGKQFLAPTPVTAPSTIKLYEDTAVMACIVAACVTKKASQLAYEEHGRAMISPDMLKVLGRAFCEVLGDI